MGEGARVVAAKGEGARFVDAVARSGFEPASHCDLSALRTILSTGSPLAPESFDFVYEKVRSDVCLSSISGGTDLISCFALGDPTGPVHPGELQVLGLGMAVGVFDPEGRPAMDAPAEGDVSLSSPMYGGTDAEYTISAPISGSIVLDTKSP